VDHDINLISCWGCSGSPRASESGSVCCPAIALPAGAAHPLEHPFLQISNTLDRPETHKYMGSTTVPVEQYRIPTYPSTQFSPYCESIFRLLLKIAVGQRTLCVKHNFWNHTLIYQTRDPQVNRLCVTPCIAPPTTLLCFSWWYSTKIFS
jgi:hypothetical protein